MVSVILSYKSSRRESILTDVATSIVCLFVLARDCPSGKLVAWYDGILLLCCFCAWASRYLASIATLYVPWRMIRQYLEIGPNFCLGGQGRQQIHISMDSHQDFSQCCEGFFFVCPSVLMLGL